MIAFLYIGYQTLVEIPAKQQVKLEFEFNKIVQLPDAHRNWYDAHNKPIQALVGAHYLTDVDADKIFKYYDEQLKQQGWQLKEIKKMTDGNQDLGGKAAYYCKGQFQAVVQYAGQMANYGWTYTLDMTWKSGICQN